MEKIFTKFLMLIFLFSLLLPSNVFAKNSLPNDNISLLIQEYFQLRQEQTISNKDNSKLLKDFEEKQKLSKNVIAFENDRKSNYAKMEKKLGIRVVLSKITPYIIDINIEEYKASANVYEWIHFDWKAEDGTLNSSGLGLNHYVMFAKINGQWEIIQDSYDEGPLSEVTTPDLLIEDQYEQKIIKPFTSENETDINNTEFSILGEPGYYITFDRSGVTTYADNYVKPYAAGTNYESYYNPLFKNFNPNGGDCANYVSQSLYEGGKLPMQGLATQYNGVGAWWYDNKGTTSTTDDTVSTNWSWTGAHYNRQNIAYNFGTIKDNPTDTDIIKGNPVYYDWDGLNVSSRWYNHATICVGTDSVGKPIVNSHNYDYYHVRWNYGYSNTGYSTVKINNSIFIPY